MTFITINFNTNLLVNLLFKTIEKNIKSVDYKLCVLDVSNNAAEFYKKDKSLRHDVEVINNTDRKIFNDNEIVKKYGEDSPLEKFKSRTNTHTSMRHAIGIDWILQNYNDDEIVLFDSDVIVKKDLDFLDNDRKKYVTIAKVHKEKIFGRDWEPRFHPCLEYFNLDMCRKYNLKYIDYIRIMESKYKEYHYWDTGASFYHDILDLNLPYKPIILKNYAIHIGKLSWFKKLHNQINEDFLKKYNKYYE